jgi:hypothetical protein
MSLKKQFGSVTPSAIPKPFSVMASRGYQMPKEIKQMMQNVQAADEASGSMSGPLTDETLDMKPDWEQDHMKVEMDGNQLQKDGKYGKGKNQLSLKEIYEGNKSYCMWVRKHISVTSSKEMQRLKVYIALRDQVKRQRLEGSQMTTGAVMLAKAKAQTKTMIKKMSRPREEEEETMEWSYVEMPGAGTELVVTMTVDGMPVQVVNPLNPDLNGEMRSLLHEMKDILDAVLPSEPTG